MRPSFLYYLLAKANLPELASKTAQPLLTQLSWAQSGFSSHPSPSSGPSLPYSTPSTRQSSARSPSSPSRSASATPSSTSCSPAASPAGTQRGRTRWASGPSRRRGRWCGWGTWRRYAMGLLHREDSQSIGRTMKFRSSRLAGSTMSSLWSRMSSSRPMRLQQGLSLFPKGLC